ncbi:DUF4190 domain-containing protein [Cryptosporangium sp. NPDC048952]|uniref:DUF4190 domain-containing protein n=1 Tax=Cryptosporangium sp. NPDC048952 TaxID=3363961 RepID=UPI00371858FE
MTNPPPGEANPWAKPTSGFPDPTSGYPNPTSGYPDPTSGYGATPGYDPNAYPAYSAAGPVPNAYPPAGTWGAPAQYPGAYPPARKQNGMALASLIVSIVSLVMCSGLPGIVGALLGHSARKQIRENGEDGEGMATAGIIVGWIGFGIAIFTIVIVIVAIAVGFFASSETSSTTY